MTSLMSTTYSFPAAYHPDFSFVQVGCASCFLQALPWIIKTWLEALGSTLLHTQGKVKQDKLLHRLTFLFLRPRFGGQQVLNRCKESCSYY